jgi:hypothetical protein
MEVEPHVKLRDRQAAIAIDCQKTDRVVRGPAEGDGLDGAGQDSLDLPVPVRQHLVDVGERLTANPLSVPRQVFRCRWTYFQLGSEPYETIASTAQSFDRWVQGGRHA